MIQKDYSKWTNSVRLVQVVHSVTYDYSVKGSTYCRVPYIVETHLFLQVSVPLLQM